MTPAPQLLRSAWLLCGDRPLAEDLVQETLAKVYVRFDRLDNPAAYARTPGLSAGAVRNRSMRALARMRERSLS